MTSLVTPVAGHSYDKREEQNFREFVRRNLSEALNRAQTANEALRYDNLPVYADNAAAGVGGLIQGQFYRTATGQLMVKL
jgi:hypothetical protein